MIKNIAYFPNQCALNSRPVMGAVLESLEQNGIRTIENSMQADAAIIWSVLWNGRMAPNNSVYEHYRKQNKPVIIIDIGALRRGETWKIAVNNITSNGYYGHTENLDNDRPKKLRINLETTTPTNPAILIAAQHRHSLQVADLGSVEEWILKQINDIRTVSDRPIAVRPHPRSTLIAGYFPKDIAVEIPAKIPNTYDSYNLNLNYHAVVNYNSGPGTQAAIAGTRPLVDKSSLAYPVSVNKNTLETPYYVDREKWLIEICHTEYTVDELTKGLWLKRISSAL